MPEMSDYLAVAFLLAAGGLWYRVRRRHNITAVSSQQ